MAQKKDRAWGIGIAVMFIVISLGGGFLLSEEIRENNIFFSGFEPMKGKVVDFVSEHATSDFGTGQGPRIVDYPVIEFEYEGKKIEFKSQVNYAISPYEIGEEVDIYVNPDDPHDARLRSYAGYKAAIVYLGLLLVLFPLGLGILFGEMDDWLPKGMVGVAYKYKKPLMMIWVFVTLVVTVFLLFAFFGLPIMEYLNS